MATGATAKRGDPPPDTAAPFVPLTPRPGLMKVLGAVFALWVAFLVVLYFRTTPARRAIEPSTQSTIDDPSAGAAAPSSR